MHRQVDCAATALARTRVVPLGAGRQNLEVAAYRVGMPATTASVFGRLESHVRLKVDRQARQHSVTRQVAQACQNRRAE